MHVHQHCGFTNSVGTDLIKFDLRQLRYFLAIGNTSSLSTAARTLNVAQSAVSHHLAEIESKLGVALVERHSWREQDATKETNHRAHGLAGAHERQAQWP